MKKKLTRSVVHRMIGGVCGGIAEYFDLDPTVVRIAFLLISIVSVAFPGILVYILAWLIIPSDNYK